MQFTIQRNDLFNVSGSHWITFSNIESPKETMIAYLILIYVTLQSFLAMKLLM